MHVIGTTTVDECSLFYAMTVRHYISLSLILCLFKPYALAFFDINVLKEVPILLYLHKNITNTILQNKAVVNYAS